MKKALSLILAIFMLLAALSGCGKTEEPIEESKTAESQAEESKAEEVKDLAAGKKVAICMGAIYHPVYRVVQMGFFQKSEELGMVPVISGLDEGNQKELIAEWEKAVTNGAEGCLIWTGDDSCYEMMKGMKEKGVYCVVPHYMHSYADTKDFISKNLASYEYTYGAAAADAIVAKLEEKGIKSGSIGITQSGASVLRGNAASNAFRARMAEIGANYTILDTRFEGAELVEATIKVTELIQETPDIVAAFGISNVSPLSWQEAVKETGRTDLVVIGLDYSEANINTVTDGDIFGIVCIPLYDEGIESAKALYELFNGADFTASEDAWFTELEAPIAYLGGEGKNDIYYYKDIFEQAQAYFE